MAPVLSQPLRLRRMVAMTIIIVAMFAALFALYVRWEKQIDRANEARQQSLLLSNELRQTSDDLTRMVRSYIATGDLRYKKYYQEILNIRNGTQPRPQNYHLVYWDLVTAGDLRPGPVGPAVSLETLVRRIGLTDAETALLDQGTARSNQLTATEFAAMALFESARPTAEASRAQALRMVFDESYHQAKSDIMQPIHEFQRIMDLRTLEAVELAKRNATLVRVIFMLFGVVLIAMRWRAQRMLHAVLGADLVQLHEHIVNLRDGNFNAVPPVPTGRPDSVMAWLAVTQGELRRQQAERLQLEHELRELAFHDGLTQLPNRRQFLDRLKHALLASKRHGSHGAVLFLDLNKFKELNDTHGHEIGDQMLIQVARRLQQAVRENDTVARLGGDEFLVLLEDLGPDLLLASDYAATVGAKIQRALSREYQIGEIRHQGSASVGISLFLGDQADADQIIKAADAAMYERKRSAQVAAT